MPPGEEHRRGAPLVAHLSVRNVDCNDEKLTFHKLMLQSLHLLYTIPLRLAGVRAMASAVAPSIEGTISAPPAVAAKAIGSSLQTLDEPVSATIMRDLRRVALKLRYVLMPGVSQAETIKELRNWDLWGPLLLCLILSILLSVTAPVDQTSLVFASVFVIVWAGAGVVTLNAQLLGGNISFFQSVCVLGYCVFPLVLAAVLCAFWSNSTWRTLLVCTALVWSTRGERDTEDDVLLYAFLRVVLSGQEAGALADYRSLSFAPPISHPLQHRLSLCRTSSAQTVGRSPCSPRCYSTVSLRGSCTCSKLVGNVRRTSIMRFPPNSSVVGCHVSLRLAAE